MKKNNLFSILVIALLFFGFVSFANPTSLPPGANKATPLNALSTSQSKIGTLHVGDLVNRAFGIRTTPASNETVSVLGGVVIGNTAGSDVFIVSANGTEINTTTVCQKTHTYASPSTGICRSAGSTSSADGVVNISSISGSGTRPLCIQQVSVSGVNYNKVVICP